jgi:hypothetical protein
VYILGVKLEHGMQMYIEKRKGRKTDNFTQLHSFTSIYIFKSTHTHTQSAPRLCSLASIFSNKLTSREREWVLCNEFSTRKASEEVGEWEKIEMERRQKKARLGEREKYTYIGRKGFA